MASVPDVATGSTVPPPKSSRPSALLPGVLAQPNRTSSREALERRLTREILVSERLRVTILAAIPILLLVVFLTLGTAYPEVLDRMIGKVDRARVGVFLALVAAYELWGLQTLERLIKSD